MDFYKKTIFVFVIMIFTFTVMVKLVEPVIEKQLSNIFSDKKFSKKLTKELINSTEDFTPEKREFYKNIIKKLYIKWIPLMEEAKSEAEKDINK
jgi:hypothetical protein